MRVVIDTNVIVSAVLRDRDPERLVMQVVADPEVRWIVTKEILNEYLDVLARPKLQLPADIVREWSEMLTAVTTIVTTDIVVPLPRDHKDAPFLACAAAGDADYLVTGDRDFSSAGALPRTKVTSVADFLRVIE